MTKNKMRKASAAYAATHESASIRRCWSTWNVAIEQGLLESCDHSGHVLDPVVGQDPRIAGLRCAVGRGGMKAHHLRTHWHGVVCRTRLLVREASRCARC